MADNVAGADKCWRCGLPVMPVAHQPTVHEAPAYGAPPPVVGGAMPQQMYRQQPSPRAITALVLGIASFFLGGCCLPLPITAWVVGKMEVNAIDRRQAPEAGRTLAQVGYIMGMVLTLLYILLVVAYIAIYGLAFVFAILAALAGG
jgi:hypothetical protein